MREKNTIHTNPSQSTLLPYPTTVQLSRVDIPSSPLKLASKTAFSTTSSREIFNNTKSNQLASPLLNDTNHTNIDTDIEADNSNMNDENALAASQHQKVEEVLVEGDPSVNEMVGIDESEESNEQEDLSILTVVQLKDRLRGLNLRLGGRKQELLDRLNNHLYPAPAIEQSDAAGADSDVDMDEETDVVVSVETDIDSDVHHDTSITHVSRVDSSILSKKNNDLFKQRTLHQITFTLPSDVDEKELGISFDQNVRFGRVGICGVSNSSSLFDQIPPKYHKRWLLLAIEKENELLELERCSDAINEMNNARRGKQVQYHSY